MNPKCPADLVIDHSVQVDYSKGPGARGKNEALELERNRERFTFLKWGATGMIFLHVSKSQNFFLI